MNPNCSECDYLSCSVCDTSLNETTGMVIGDRFWTIAKGSPAASALQCLPPRPAYSCVDCHESGKFEVAKKIWDSCFYSVVDGIWVMERERNQLR